MVPDRFRATGTKPTANSPAVPRSRVVQMLSALLIGFGLLSLLSAMTYTAYALLNTWLMGQDYYLVSDDIAPLPVPVAPDTPSPTRVITAARATTVPHTMASRSMPTGVGLSRATQFPVITPTPSFTATAASVSIVTATASATKTASPLPMSTPQATARPSSPPVRIRIPTLQVNRSIISLQRARDRRTGAWTWNTKRLFRPGRQDLVGHSEGSADPGQEGNMILVGHNYGYGYSGVFVRLGRLKAGHKVYVINQAGRTFTYKVETVNRVKWRRKDLGELTQHLTFLATGGPERLTLVSCSGANVEPFPERIYIVAKPVQ